jgi:uncharacterized Zn-finger protein
MFQRLFWRKTGCDFFRTYFLLQNPSTFELEQALMNMESEILLGDEGQCPLCQKIFNRKTSLLNHIRNHSADKKYICNYCQKGFSQQANLRNHERIHTNDRPYVW